MLGRHDSLNLQIQSPNQSFLQRWWHRPCYSAETVEPSAANKRVQIEDFSFYYLHTVYSPLCCVNPCYSTSISAKKLPIYPIHRVPLLLQYLLLLNVQPKPQTSRHTCPTPPPPSYTHTISPLNHITTCHISLSCRLPPCLQWMWVVRVN